MGKGDPEGGRPPVELTDEQKSQVEALAQYLNQDQIAGFLGISRPTFAAIMARDPEVSLRYNRGLSTAIAAVGQGLLQKAREGHVRQQEFYLQTKGGWTRSVSIDNTSSDGSMSTKQALSDEELKKELERRGLPATIFEE